MKFGVTQPAKILVSNGIGRVLQRGDVLTIILWKDACHLPVDELDAAIALLETARQELRCQPIIAESIEEGVQNVMAWLNEAQP